MSLFVVVFRSSLFGVCCCLLFVVVCYLSLFVVCCCLFVCLFVSQPGRLRLNHVLSIKCAISLVAATEEWKVKLALLSLAWLAFQRLVFKRKQDHTSNVLGPRLLPRQFYLLVCHLEPIWTTLGQCHLLLYLLEPQSICIAAHEGLTMSQNAFSVKLQTEQGAMILEFQKESLREEEGRNPHQTAGSGF